MKIYFNRQPVTGPWGGGNKTVTALAERMAVEGHEVTFNLNENIDVIFCFDPRPNQIGEWYQSFVDYKHKHPNCKIIQRVGDIGTHGKPELTNLVIQSTQLSDFLIFPSDWARKVIDFKKKNYDIVPNSPLATFYKNRNVNIDIKDNVRIVTHHWSTNPLKGFELYSELRDKINNKKLLDMDLNYEFTYIGRYPDDLTADGIKVIEPMHAAELAEELPSHHIYLTASLAEAGANHVLEALAAGLPVIYHNHGGSIPEYCAGYGLEYDNFDSMTEALSEMIKNYQYFRRKANKFNRVMSDSISNYVDVICSVYEKR